MGHQDRPIPRLGQTMGDLEKPARETANPRHFTITDSAASQARDSTILALAGHVSRKMLEHYSHVCQEAKREAVSVLSAKISKLNGKRSYDTNHDTKLQSRIRYRRK
jgi:hypothetical protein